MLIPFSLELCSKHFRFDKYVAICILDVQETSRRCRRKFRKHTYARARARAHTHTHTHTQNTNILVFTRIVHERARNGQKFVSFRLQ